MIGLLHYAGKRKVTDMEYDARLHGFEIDKPKVGVEEEPKPDPFLFGDPENYKKMSKEEQIKATQAMKGNHLKGFSKGI